MRPVEDFNQHDHVILVDFREKEEVIPPDLQSPATELKPEVLKERNNEVLPQTTVRESATKPPAPSNKKTPVIPVAKKLQEPVKLSSSSENSTVIKAREIEAEIAALEAARIREEQKRGFSSLLSRSANLAAVSSGLTDTNDISTGAASKNEGSGDSAYNSGNSGSVSGELGSRRILRKPVIRDDSQKKGRVVVRICVNGEGNVISSAYSLKGSTTSDNYLISLAEKGVFDYKFTRSSVERECGEVVIDFMVK